MIVSDTTSQILTKIRQDIATITKSLDELINYVETALNEREAELDGKIKQLAVLTVKEKSLNEKEAELLEARKLVTKEKELNRIKKDALDNREKELNDKIQKVKGIMT